MRFNQSYLPSEFLAFRHRLKTAVNRLCWDKIELNNFAVRIIGGEVCDDLDKMDWEHLLACIEDLPTPLSSAPPTPKPAAPVTPLLAFVQMASAEELRSLYRSMSKRLHPDTGGDAVKMRELNLLWEKLEKNHG